MTPVGPSTERATPAPRARRSGRWVFGWCFVVFTLIGMVWAFTNPLAAAPDETSHIIKAAAVGHGDLAPSYDVVVLQQYAQAPALVGCFAFYADQTADCAPVPDEGRDHSRDETTGAGIYNPVYFMLVGWVTLLPVGGAAGLYLLRLMSVLLNSAMLALAFRAAAESRHPAAMVTGVIVAMTPEVVFIASSVNPSGLEMTAAIALWACLIHLLEGGTRTPDVRARSLRVGLAAFLMVTCKGISPLYLGVIAAVCAVFAGRRRVIELVRDRRAWPGLAIGLVGWLFSVAWIVISGILAGSGDGASTTSTLAQSFRLVFGTRLAAYSREAIAVFGWLDTEVSPIIVVAVALGGVCWVAAGLLIGRRRERIAIGLLVLAVLLVPPVVMTVLSIGPMWQGRYIMPIASGLAILAAASLGAAGRAWPRQLRWAPPAATVVFGAAGLACWAYNLRRYQTGARGRWDIFAEHAWNPWLPTPVALALYLVALTGLFCIVVAIGRPRAKMAHDATGPGRLDRCGTPPRDN